MGHSRLINFWLDWWCGDEPLINNINIDIYWIDTSIKVSDVLQDGEWDLSNSVDYCLEMVEINSILSHFIADNVIFADKITWNGTSNKKFSTKSALVMMKLLKMTGDELIYMENSHS